MEYVKDRTEDFDDYYPCIKKKDFTAKYHMFTWMTLFIFMYNTVTMSNIKPNKINNG
jgi:hypothetical protein